MNWLHPFSYKAFFNVNITSVSWDMGSNLAILLRRKEVLDRFCESTKLFYSDESQTGRFQDRTLCDSIPWKQKNFIINFFLNWITKKSREILYKKTFWNESTLNVALNDNTFAFIHQTKKHKFPTLLYYKCLRQYLFILFLNFRRYEFVNLLLSFYINLLFFTFFNLIFWNMINSTFYLMFPHKWVDVFVNFTWNFETLLREYNPAKFVVLLMSELET